MAALHMLDLVRQGAVFLVLARLELLVGVLGQSVPSWPSTSSSRSLRADSISLIRSLACLQLGLRVGGLGLKRLPLRLDVGQLASHPAKLLVSVLQDQQLFNRFEHSSSPLNADRVSAAAAPKSMNLSQSPYRLTGVAFCAGLG